MHYNADKAINAKAWLARDEQERIDLVIASYHRLLYCFSAPS
jgi:hypothetical protein